MLLSYCRHIACTKHLHQSHIPPAWHCNSIQPCLLLSSSGSTSPFSSSTRRLTSTHSYKGSNSTGQHSSFHRSSNPSGGRGNRSSNDSGSNSSGSSSSLRPPPSGEISSTANAYIKHCVRLRESSRYRQQQQRLLVAGSTLLAELAEATPDTLKAIALFIRPGCSPPPGLLSDSVISVSDSVMKKLTGLEEVGGVQMAAELQLPAFADLSIAQLQLRQQEPQQANRTTVVQQQQQLHMAVSRGTWQQGQQLQRLLVLEGVQDPGNLGTLLRCATAFGWDAVWLLPGCCDPFNDKALRASRGAAFKCPLASGSLQQLLDVVEEHQLLLLAAEPDPVAAEEHAAASTATAAAAAHAGASGLPVGVKLPSDAEQQHGQLGSSRANNGHMHHGTPAAGTGGRPVALVLGSEGAGLSAEVLRVATPLAVPMQGQMESLNVAVAGSILMFCLSGGLPQLMGRLHQMSLLHHHDDGAS